MVQDGARIDAGKNLKRDTGRQVGLDQAGNDIDTRTLGCQNQMDTGSAGHLGQTSDRLLDFAPCDHHQVGQLVDDHHDTRQMTMLKNFAVLHKFRHGYIFVAILVINRRGDWLFGIFKQAFVVSVDITNPLVRHQSIATLHFPHGPGKCHGSLFGVGHHRQQQMRHPFVNG